MTLWMELHLSIVSNHTSVSITDSIEIVLHLVIPGLDSVAPGVLVAGHVEILTTSAGCSRRRKQGCPHKRQLIQMGLKYFVFFVPLDVLVQIDILPEDLHFL